MFRYCSVSLPKSAPLILDHSQTPPNRAGRSFQGLTWKRDFVLGSRGGTRAQPGSSPCWEPPATAYNKYPWEEPRVLRSCYLATDENILQKAWVLVRQPSRARGQHSTNYQPLKALSVSSGLHCFQVCVDCFVHTQRLKH